MKKFLLAGAIALAALTVSASSAMASSFPHSDPNPTHWTWVDSDPASFQAVATASILDGAISCNVVLDVTVDDHGYTEITSATISPGGGACNFITANDLYPSEDKVWDDQICEYTGTSPHEYWDRINVSFHVALPATPPFNVTGEVFGQLKDSDSSGGFDRIDINSDVGTTGHHITADGSSASSPYLLDSDLGVVSNEDPCPDGTVNTPASPAPWPELAP